MTAQQNVVTLRTDAPTRVADKISAGQELSLLDRLAIYQTVSRVWRRGLDTYEITALTYIVDRTVGWGRDHFFASSDNILYGSEEYSGVGLSRRKYFQVIKSLEERGMISRKSTGDRTRITLNLSWTPDMLPIPKRLKKATAEGEECTTRTLRSAPRAPQECTTCTLNTDSKNTVIIGADLADARSHENPSPSPDEERRAEFSADQNLQLVAGIRSRVRSTQDASRVRQADRAESVKSSKADKVRAGDVEIIWKNALYETFPKHMHIAWSRKSLGMASGLVKKWAYSADGTVAQFIDFSVRNWSQIIRRRFKWMTAKPAPTYPSLHFLVWQLPVFVEVWTSGELSKFVQDADNDAYARLRANGRTHDEAVRELARRDAVSATRKEMADRETKVRQREQTAKRREDRAERMEGLVEKHGTALRPAAPTLKGWAAGAGVVHPRSRTAEAMGRPSDTHPAQTGSVNDAEISLPRLDGDFDTWRKSGGKA